MYSAYEYVSLILFRRFTGGSLYSHITVRDISSISAKVASNNSHQGLGTSGSDTLRVLAAKYIHATAIVPGGNRTHKFVLMLYSLVFSFFSQEPVIAIVPSNL
jgi:hypothetical protein